MGVSIQEGPATYRPDQAPHGLGGGAGIAAATRVSRERRRPAQGTVERRLGGMVESELARLDLLLSAAAPDRRSAAELSALIGEVVLCHRLRGLDVRWQHRRCGVVVRQRAVREALHVLLDNAARDAAGGEVTITVTPRGGGVEIAVTDGGRVAERGARGDGPPGWGMGLPLARRLAVGFGGTLDLDESYDAGARFVLWVPVRGRTRRSRS